MSPVKPANTNGGKLKIVLRLPAAKGQLILKCPFGVFKSPKKNYEIFSRISTLASKKRSNQKKIRALYTANKRPLELEDFI